MPAISSISINWWRHLKYQDKLTLKRGVNLIIGKNGSGKTSLLKMIYEASKGSAQNLVEEARTEENNTELVKIILGSGEDVDVVSNVKRNNDNGEWTASNLLSERVRFISSQRSVSSGDTSKNALIQSLSGDVGMPAPDQAIDVAEEFNKAINRELYTKILEMSAGDPDFLKKIQEDYQSGLVDFEKSLKIDLKRENTIYFVDHRDREVQISNLSSGEKEYLYFYAFLRRIQTDEDNIILIDEPELHLHSSQIRKLCELISNVAVKNQVIIATHSGEVLHYFISQANLALLSKGTVTNIADTEELKMALEETGLPLDPSVFTAHWICAENEPTKTLKGVASPTTPEALSWIFGKDIAKRYWSFGSQKALADAHMTGLTSVLPQAVPIKLTAIYDADRLANDFTSYPPTIPTAQSDIRYLPFWEFENLFLSPSLLDKVIVADNGKSGFERFWDIVSSRKEELKAQVIKTVTKNKLRQFHSDKYIKTNVVADFTQWQSEVANITIDPAPIETSFEQVITGKQWQWIPGKEALAMLLEIEPNFWKGIRELQLNKQLKSELQKDATIQSLITEVESIT